MRRSQLRSCSEGKNDVQKFGRVGVDDYSIFFKVSRRIGESDPILAEATWQKMPSAVRRRKWNIEVKLSREINFLVNVS